MVRQLSDWLGLNVLYATGLVRIISKHFLLGTPYVDHLRPNHQESSLISESCNMTVIVTCFTDPLISQIRFIHKFNFNSSNSIPQIHPSIHPFINSPISSIQTSTSTQIQLQILTFMQPYPLSKPQELTNQSTYRPSRLYSRSSTIDSRLFDRYLYMLDFPCGARGTSGSFDMVR